MKTRLALSIRQPFIEEILAGTKTFEFRRYSTRVRDKVVLYAPRRGCPSDLPSGCLLGEAEIVECLGMIHEGKMIYGWQLDNVRRFRRAVYDFTGSPQPSFWRATY